MRELTYDRIFKDLEVIRCETCWKLGVCERGRIDFADINRGIIHWQERKVTKPGLRNFLKLYVSIWKSHNRGQPIWQQLHEQNTHAYEIARGRYGIILPKRLSKVDRARALADLVNVTPQPQPAIQWAKEVLKWT